MRRLLLSVVLGALIGTTGAIGQRAFAETEINAKTVAVRIDLAGRQRMLAERMAKSFCFARSNVDPMSQVERLQSAMAAFDEFHTGFVEGNDTLELFPEASKDVLVAWERVDLMWFPLRSIYQRALDGVSISEREFAQVVGLTLELRNRSNDLVAQIRHKYAKVFGQGGLSEGILLDVYGRQRMLSQKLSKEVCLLAYGHDREATTMEISETLKLFDNSIRAFIEGLPIAGIPKPPTEEIASQLRVADTIWTAYRPIVATLAGGGAATLGELAQVADESDAFFVEMNKAVKMLAAYQGSTS
ncbi:MAG: type IV pili methyl-accepting chemotaxis transducer N-terminal domain-containing protein [Pseudomonadota bacterium]